MKGVFDSPLRLVPNLAQVVAPEQHKERPDELVRLVLPLLQQIALHLVDLVLHLVLHLIQFVLHAELLLVEEGNVELFRGVASLKVAPNVQVVIFHDSRDKARC